MILKKGTDQRTELIFSSGSFGNDFIFFSPYDTQSNNANRENWRKIVGAMILLLPSQFIN